MKLAQAYSFEDSDSLAADVLIQIIESSEATAAVVARCIFALDAAKRTDEAERLIQRMKTGFVGDSDFAAAWARHAIRSKNKGACLELAKPPWIEAVRPAYKVLLQVAAGMTEEAISSADGALADVQERNLSRWELEEMSNYFHSIGRWDDFRKVAASLYPEETIQEFARRGGRLRRR